MKILHASLLVMGLTALSSACLADDESERQERLFETLDQNGDGTLDSDEVNDQQRQAFERLLRVGDSNDDGKLTRDEYLKGLKPESPGEPNQPGRRQSAQRGGPQRGDIDRLFKSADRDGDGKIALDDLPEPMQLRLLPLFERIGKDEITREDFRRTDRTPGARPQGQNGARPQMALLRVLDEDRDGQLSPEELAQIKEKFSTLDRNKDGQLTPGELLGFAANGMRPGNAGQRPGDSPRSQRPRRPDQSPETDRPRTEQPQGRPQSRGRGQAIRQFDKDGDGALSRDEAPERLKERFDRVDADSDGKLTVEELGKAFRPGQRD